MCLRASTTQLRYSSWGRAKRGEAGSGGRARGRPPGCRRWEGRAYLALARGGGHLAQLLLLRGLGGVLGQFVEHVGARRVGDVQVVGEGRAVGGRAGEGVLLVGLLCGERGGPGVSGR